MKAPTSEEKFIFDLEGYLVVKNVLSSEEVDKLNAIADQKMAQVENKDGFRNVGKPSSWAPPLQNLMDHPRIMPLSARISGLQGAHRSRLLHLYAKRRPAWSAARWRQRFRR